MEVPEIAGLLGAMAVDAIGVQLRLDLNFQAELRRWSELVPNLGVTDLPGFLLPLLPRRLRAERLEMSFQAALAVTKTTQFEIRLLPLNAQFIKRTSATVSRYSRLSFSVHQVPVSRSPNSHL